MTASTISGRPERGRLEASRSAPHEVLQGERPGGDAAIRLTVDTQPEEEAPLAGKASCCAGSFSRSSCREAELATRCASHDAERSVTVARKHVANLAQTPDTFSSVLDRSTHCGGRADQAGSEVCPAVSPIWYT